MTYEWLYVCMYVCTLCTCSVCQTVVVTDSLYYTKTSSVSPACVSMNSSSRRHDAAKVSSSSTTMLRRSNAAFPISESFQEWISLSSHSKCCAQINNYTITLMLWELHWQWWRRCQKLQPSCPLTVSTSDSVVVASITTWRHSSSSCSFNFMLSA